MRNNNGKRRKTAATECFAWNDLVEGASAETSQQVRSMASKTNSLEEQRTVHFNKD